MGGKKVFKVPILLLLLASLALAVPQIYFVDPTPPDGITTGNATITFNISMTEPSLGEFNWNLNGTNYTLYDSSLILMLNFDKVAALNENTSSNFTADVSRYGINGNCSGMGVACNWTTGKFGNALYFNSTTNQLVNLGNSTYLPNGTTPRSMCAWSMPATTTSGAIVFYGTRSTGQGMSIYRSTSTLYGSSLSTNDGVSYPNFWFAGVWRHVCLTYDGTTARLYGDGNLLNSGTQSWNLVRNATFVGSDLSNTVNGTIDEVRIYNRTLSDAEVFQLYVSNLYKYDTDKWQFYSNQSLAPGNYTYYGSAKDTSDNANATEPRSISTFVGSCGALGMPNSVYTLNQSITASNATCFTLNSTNVTLDCDGFSITNSIDNSTTAYGVWATTPYSRVRNCVVSNFTHGIWFSGVSNATIENNNITVNSQGNAIRVNASSQWVVVNNNTVNSTNSTGRCTSAAGCAALYVYGTSSVGNFSITNNIAWATNGSGIYLYTLYDSNVTNNSGTSTTGSGGISATSLGDRNYWLNNTGFSVNGTGFSASVDTYSNNSFINNTGKSNTSSGMYLAIGYLNCFAKGNYGESVTSTGFSASTGSSGFNNSFVNNTGISSTSTGFSGSSAASYTEFTNITGLSVNGTGVDLSASYVTAVNIFGSSSTGTGISVSGTGSALTNSTGLTNTSRGIYISSSYVTANNVTGISNATTCGPSYSCVGIYISGSTGVVVNNSVGIINSCTSTSAGIYLVYNAHVVANSVGKAIIFGGTGSNCYGICLGGSSTYTRYNQLVNITGVSNGSTGYGLYLSNIEVNYNTITNSTFSSKSTYGVYASSASSNIITNVNAESNTTGTSGSALYLSSASNFSVTGGSYRGAYGVYLSSSGLFNATNATFNGSAACIYLSTSTGNYFLNVSRNCTTVFANFTGVSNLTRQWYARANVTDGTTGLPVADGTAVNATDAFGTSVFNGTTTSGLTDFFVVTDFVGNSTSNVSYTPHNITATSSALVYNSSNFTLNFTQTANLQLSVFGTCDPASYVDRSLNLTSSQNSTGRCFTITASDVTLDCAGYSINGSATAEAIVVNPGLNNVIIQNCSISNFSTGVFLNQTRNVTLSSLVLDNNSVGINASGARIAFVGNSTITNSSSLYDVFSGNSSETRAVNSSLNLSKLGWADYTSNVSRWWYLDVHIIDADGNGVSGATVSSYDAYGSLAFSTATNSSGWIEKQAVKEWFANLSGENTKNYTPHSVNASGTGFTNSTTVNITNNTAVTLMLRSICGSLTSNTTLLDNVTTAGSCFTIDADNVVLDCNGKGVTSSNGSGTGVAVNARQNVTVKNCVFSNFSIGVFLNASSFANVSNASLLNNSQYGILVNGSSFDNYNVSISSVTVNGRSVYYYFNQQDASLSPSDPGFVQVAFGSNINLSNFAVSGDGLRVDSVVNLSAVNVSSAGAYYNLFVSNSSNASVTNSTLSSATAADVYATSAASPVFLNTSFNISGVSFGDSASNLTARWYLNVRTTNITDGAFPNASVNITDAFGSLVFNGTTDSTGNVTANLTALILFGNGTTANYTPFNASAFSNVTASSLVYLNQSQSVTLKLAEAAVDIVSPTQNQVFYQGATITIQVNETRLTGWIDNVSVLVQGDGLDNIYQANETSADMWSYSYSINSSLDPTTLTITAFGYNGSASSTNVTDSVSVTVSRLPGGEVGAPDITAFWSNHTYLVKGENASIVLRASLDTVLSSVTLNMTYPNSTVVELSPVSNSSSGYDYNYSYSVNASANGTYQLSVLVTDVNSLSTSASAAFYAVNSADVVNATAEGASAVDFYDVSSGVLLSSNNASFNTTMPAGLYTVVVTTQKPALNFSNASVNSSVSSIANFSDSDEGAATPPTNRRAVELFTVSNGSMGFSAITLSYNYSNHSGTLVAEASLELYKCTSAANCSWENLNTTVLNTTAKTVSVTLSSLFGLFGLFEPAYPNPQYTTTTIQLPGGSQTIYKEGKNMTEYVPTRVLSVPPAVPMYSNDTITVPIVVMNDLNVDFHNVTLAAQTNASDLLLLLEKTAFGTVTSKSKVSTYLNVSSHSQLGVHQIMLSAEIGSLNLTDSVIFIVDLVENVSLAGAKTRFDVLREFAGHLFADNPECGDFEILLAQADASAAKGDLVKGALLASSAIDGCRELLSRFGKTVLPEKRLFVAGGVDAAVVAGILAATALAAGFAGYYFGRLRERNRREQKEKTE